MRGDIVAVGISGHLWIRRVENKPTIFARIGPASLSVPLRLGAPAQNLERGLDISASFDPLLEV